MKESAEGNTSPLENASAAFQRRSYSLLYRDQFLVQLAKRAPHNPIAIAVLLTLGVGFLALAAFLLWLARRGWHIVTITTTPEGRLITHSLWSKRPPEI